MTDRQRVVVAGHSGYCGNLGPPTLVLSLKDSQVVKVTLPCSLAQPFLAKALSRLGG